MKLTRLYLKAFGPFTNRMIEFNADGPGLHIIFGSNEAGKSSSLRALKALLYGFEQKTPDNFIHNYDQLLVGGDLQNRTGEEISFYRRKKRKGDVVDKDGNPMDADALSPFIHGIKPEIFKSLYGIDHHALVQGGEDILDQKGEVGQALFAAGAGISSLREVIEQLESEAAELFKRAGQKQKINMAVKRYKSLQKELNAAMLSIKQWKDHQKRLKQVEFERERLELQQDEKNRALHRLMRLQAAAPELASLKSWQDQLLALGEIVPLNPGFAQTHQALNQEIRETHQLLRKDADRLEKLKKKCKAVSFNSDILLHAEKVDDFHQRLGEYRKGQKDLPERNGMRVSHRREAADFLKMVRADLTLDTVEELRSVLSRKRTIQSLISRYNAIDQQLELARKHGQKAARERKDVTKKLAEISEAKTPLELIQAIKLAQKIGNVDGPMEQRRHDVDMARKECLVDLERIGRWSGDLSQLMALPLPLPETVRQYEDRFSVIVDEKWRIEKAHKDIETDLKATRAEIKKIASSGEVPSEAALTRIREKREQGWQLLRRQWLNQEDVAEESRLYDPEQPLVVAYEGNVGDADLIADRLRREADRIAHAAALGVRNEELKEALADNDSDIETLYSREQELRKEWDRVWQPVDITPLSPKEMSGWLARMDKLRFRVGEVFKIEQNIRLDLKQRKDLRQAVLKELLSLGESAIPDGETLDPVLILAETVLERTNSSNSVFEKLKERQEQSDKAIAQAKEDFESAQQALLKWQGQWGRAIDGLGLKGDVGTLEAIERIENLEHCFDRLKAADDLKKRVDGMDRDARLLETEVEAVVEKVAPDLSTLSLDQAILKLRTLLSQAQKDDMLHQEISKEIDVLQVEMSSAQKKMENAQEQMDELLRIAKCDKQEDLASVISKYEQSVRYQEKISDTEANLAKIGAGMTIEELSKQVSEINPDELPGLVSSLERDIKEMIYPEIKKISQVIGEEKLKLDAMDGSAKAALMAEEMEQELARIRRFSEQYVLLKLASKVLQQEIERYRNEHQDPVLKIASRYFNDLTLGSFIGLRTDVDDKGLPILVGLRPDNRRLTVDKMSTGTRDQLFLALRLATLEWRLETNESIPFIVDDILINFDDERSKATLAALADLSKKNQVILFTHHRQILESAKHVQGKGAIHIHEL